MIITSLQFVESTTIKSNDGMDLLCTIDFIIVGVRMNRTNI
jgi:hypothetical protein